MKYKILIYILIILVFTATTNVVFAQQLGGGVICDSDEKISECLDNAPNISIDGISVSEFIPYSFLFLFFLILFLIIGISTVVIWRIKKK